ncbi:MAG: cell division protein ZapD [Gammaproteobacteria bacterium]
MLPYITYEQPLNERVRTFLRIEYLFQQVDHYVTSPSEWDCRYALSTLLNIVDFLSRSDIKTEVIKELERHVTTLTALKKTPGVDEQRLQVLLQEINGYLASLRDGSYQPGQSLRQDEFITSIKQRSTIPGGSCNFDLPSYYYWLSRPVEERSIQLRAWQQDLDLIKKSIRLSLQMIRNSTNPSAEQAVRGFYQKPIESNIPCQLIRVILPSKSKFYPEISGGRHRFTVRFMEQSSTSERPVQTQETVQFDLHCCIL